MWTNFIAGLPEVGRAFVTLYDDGGGARVFRRIDEKGVVDEEESYYNMESFPEIGFVEWCYLPASYKLWYEVKHVE